MRHDPDGHGPLPQAPRLRYEASGIEACLEGQTDDWLHVLHRQKDERDIFLIANQNHQGRDAEVSRSARPPAASRNGGTRCGTKSRLPNFQRIDAETVEIR